MEQPGAGVGACLGGAGGRSGEPCVFSSGRTWAARPYASPVCARTGAAGLRPSGDVAGGHALLPDVPASAPSTYPAAAASLATPGRAQHAEDLALLRLFFPTGQIHGARPLALTRDRQPWLGFRAGHRLRRRPELSLLPRASLLPLAPTWPPRRRRRIRGHGHAAGGGGRRGTAARWNRRTGAEGLPRGVVETSSDRFLRSLWDSTSKHADTKMAKATLLVYCTSPFVYWSCHQSHIVEISDSEFQFRCLNGQFLTASNQDVISATTDSPGDSETFYIERNNTMLHIKLSNGSYLQVTDNNQLTSNYRSQPGWGDDMATFQMTIAANNLHGDYQLANGYRPVQAKAVLTEHRQNTIPEMRTALVASKSAGPYLIALCLYMIAARFF